MVSASAVCWAVHPCFLLPQLMGKDLPSAPLASRRKPLVLLVVMKSRARSASGHAMSITSLTSPVERDPFRVSFFAWARYE